MSPNLSISLYTKIFQKNVHQEEKNNQEISDQKLSNSKKYEWKIVWRNVILFIYFHIGALYGFYLWGNGVKGYTILWCKYKHFNLFSINYRIRILEN